MAYPDIGEYWRDHWSINDDYRQMLKKWIEKRCPDPRGYLKRPTAQFRLATDLALDLVDRKKSGFSKNITRMLLKHEIERCGKTGECQQHKETKDRRYIGHYCNHRQFHAPCTIRYRNGQGVEMKNQFMEIVKKNNLWGVYSWTFTLPDGVQKWIESNIKNNREKVKAFLLDARRGVALTIKRAFGLTAKTRGLQPGFKILYHACSSGKPFNQFHHFHTLGLPLLADLKAKKLTEFPKMIDLDLVKSAYKEFLDRALKKHGLDRFICKSYVVHLRYVDRNHKSSINHAFKYNNRSQSQDLLRTIKRVTPDFERFVCVLTDKKEQIQIPLLANKKQVLNALEFILNPVISIAMSYGFMRVLPKYSDLLGVKQVDEENDDDWEFLYTIDILRIAKSLWDKERGKVRTQTDVLIRGPDDSRWKRIDPSELRGETTCMTDRKIYKAVE